jgi:hypothetical protein
MATVDYVVAIELTTQRDRRQRVPLAVRQRLPGPDARALAASARHVRLDGRGGDVPLDRQRWIVAPVGPRAVVDPNPQVPGDLKSQSSVGGPDPALAVGHDLLPGKQAGRLGSGSDVRGVAHGAVGAQVYVFAETADV